MCTYIYLYNVPLVVMMRTAATSELEIGRRDASLQSLFIQTNMVECGMRPPSGIGSLQYLHKFAERNAILSFNGDLTHNLKECLKLST